MGLGDRDWEGFNAACLARLLICRNYPTRIAHSWGFMLDACDPCWIVPGLGILLDTSGGDLGARRPCCGVLVSHPMHTRAILGAFVPCFW